MSRSRQGTSLLLVAIIAAAGITIASARPQPALAYEQGQEQGLPDRLADTTFWRIVSTFSEPSGWFPSENFVSNEADWQEVIPDVARRVRPGAAYLGVGPEQNFTYIAALQPRIAFICDIRRQNLVQHLMYKALMELSPDRADFLSRLWSRQRPPGLDTATSPAALLAAYRSEKPDSLLYFANIGAMFTQLVDHHGMALSSADSATLRSVYAVFFAAGPDISYSSRSGSPMTPPGFPTIATGPGLRTIIGNGTVWMRTMTINPGGAQSTTTWTSSVDSTGHVRVMRDSGGTWVIDTSATVPTFQRMSGPIAFGAGYPTFGSLMTEDDGAGVNRGWLGSESAYRWLRDFQLRNLIVPVVGDFGGDKALRSIAAYLGDHGARVGAFYTSNVEQYLFQNRADTRFYANVAAFPADANSTFIRSFPFNHASVFNPRHPGSRLAQTTSSIDTVLRAFRAGTLRTYSDLAGIADIRR